jgi:hypothetical protein
MVATRDERVSKSETGMQIKRTLYTAQDELKGTTSETRLLQCKKTIGVRPSGGVPVDISGHVVLPRGHRLQLVHVVELQLTVDVLQPSQNDELALQSAEVTPVSAYCYNHRCFRLSDRSGKKHNHARKLCWSLDRFPELYCNTLEKTKPSIRPALVLKNMQNWQHHQL